MVDWRCAGLRLRRTIGLSIAAAVLNLEPGVGIMGMRERMRQLGGCLEITSNGRATTVEATVPLPDRSQMREEMEELSASPA